MQQSQQHFWLYITQQSHDLKHLHKQHKSLWEEHIVREIVYVYVFTCAYSGKIAKPKFESSSSSTVKPLQWTCVKQTQHISHLLL